MRRPLLPALLATAALAIAALVACGPPAGDRSAAELYPKYCAKCHGADGKGDPRQVSLYPNLNLTTSKLTGKGAHLAIYNRIAQGYGPMPGFAHRLSAPEMSRLADYSLQLNPANGK